MQHIYGFVGFAGGPRARLAASGDRAPLPATAGATVLLPRSEDQRGLPTIHWRNGGADLIVFGDRLSDANPARTFDSLDQALPWIGAHFSRFCGLWSQGRRLEIFTDHAAACPLFYATDPAGGLVVACRLAALADAGIKLDIALDENRRPLPGRGETAFKGIKAVPPGHVVAFDLSGDRPRMTDTTAYAGISPPADIQDEATARTLIVDALSASVLECLAGADEIAVTLSGGIDSASVAFLARPHVRKMHTYTVGTPYGNEFAEAAFAAARLGSIHRELSMSLADAGRILSKAIAAFETWDPLTLQIALPVCFLYERVSGMHPVFLTGYGSDLIFGGVIDLTRPPAEIDQELRRQVAMTVPTNELSPAFAAMHGIAVRYPFWTRRVLRDGLRVGGFLKSCRNVEKYVFRKAMSSFLPDETAWRKKRGIHEGTAMSSLFADLLGTPDHARQIALLRGIASDVLIGEAARDSAVA
jgi:carbapenam-3-carboxylate synthase